MLLLLVTENWFHQMIKMVEFQWMIPINQRKDQLKLFDKIAKNSFL